MRSASINGRDLSERVLLIAEIGSNHNGDVEEAKRYIRAAAEAGADAVKFQTFAPEKLYVPIRPKGSGWEPHPAIETLRKYMLRPEWHEDLAGCARDAGVAFLSTPFDEESAGLLAGIGCRAFKIASGDMTHFRLLACVARLADTVLMSTGMASMAEVDSALAVLRKHGDPDVVLFHCVSNYPPKDEAINLRAISTMQSAFGVPIGLSDHSAGPTMPIAAVALGARAIEKHVTFSRKLEGPDHPYALEMDDFGQMAREIRRLEKGLGDGRKAPAEDEVPERSFARRGVYFRRDMGPDETIRAEDLVCLRPCAGIPADMIDLLPGRRTRRGIWAWEPFGWESV